jgi:hypothetical protein
MKQTAVEWLAEKTAELGYVSSNILEQAKAMEKEQVMLAFNDGKVNSVLNKRGSEEYYQDTYGKGIL